MKAAAAFALLLVGCATNLHNARNGLEAATRAIHLRCPPSTRTVRCDQFAVALRRADETYQRAVIAASNDEDNEAYELLLSLHDQLDDIGDELAAGGPASH